jgi:Bacterial Ig domain
MKIKSNLPARLKLSVRAVLMSLVMTTVSVAYMAASPNLYAANVEVEHDHVELDATIDVPYRSTSASEARSFKLQLAYPTNAAVQVARWHVQVRAPSGAVVDEWRGVSPLERGAAELKIEWAGRVGKNANLADGIYTVHMSALSVERTAHRALAPEMTALDDIATLTNGDLIGQSWEIRVGNPPTPKMPAFAAMKTSATANAAAKNTESSAAAKAGDTNAAPSTASLPYTVYYGNLHSQTNHSDGGGNVATCTSSQAAQTGQFGPADAFTYGKTAGLDVLMTSEHNHYFDGSSGTNGSATTTGVHNLYQSGLTAAANFNTANPGFLAIYGMEWGVISNGGHMNIFGSNELLGWETNTSGQLLADALTPKSDYATIYSVMKQRGLVGQFNHPDTSGQFVIGGTSLAYNADGDEVMALAEIMNTSAFSSNTTETETGRSNFESAFNMLLERGFHVAPASNQDNHCANWGTAYTNRTAVLLPNGSALNTANYLAALKARRVFATMDKNSQLVLTANGKVMGERFQNSGALSLKANFANSAGRSVSTVSIFEGVPGRNGTVTTLATAATATTTPSLGKHFYYAKVTQDDGKILWSAPIWVEQVTATVDTTAPVVSASSTGTSGTITFNATATDNVGVTRVDFYVDNVLKGNSSTAPYSYAFASTTVTDGVHSLVAKAVDAAGNVGSSTAQNFTVSNAPVTVNFNEAESNGSIAAANVVARNVTNIIGTMGNTTDKDYFAVALNANEKITLNMTGPSGKDYDLYLLSSTGTTLTSSTGSTATETLTYTNNATAKTVYIQVLAYSGSSTTLTYNVKITRQ